MRNKPTIAQVAERAQVAASTVSRVLNGGYASVEVKTRVQQVIRDLGYTPSMTARNLKMGRTGVVGLVVETSQGTGLQQLLSGVEERLVDQQLCMVLATLSAGADREQSQVWSWIRERRVDGLIFARPGWQERALIEAATAVDIPTALVAPDDDFSALAAVFTTKHRAGGRELGRHLGELGHTRIAFGSGPEASLAARERLAGLCEGLEAQGLALTDSWFGTNHDAEQGVLHAQRWLALPKEAAPTAVVLGCDAMALAFMRTVQQAGIAIPEQLSVAGFDGAPEASLSWPGLTTISEPTRQMGSDACDYVLSRINSSIPSEPDGVSYAMRLCVRESSGVVRDLDYPVAKTEPQRAVG